MLLTVPTVQENRGSRGEHTALLLTVPTVQENRGSREHVVGSEDDWKVLETASAKELMRQVSHHVSNHVPC